MGQTFKNPKRGNRSSSSKSRQRPAEPPPKQSNAALVWIGAGSVVFIGIIVIAIAASQPPPQQQRRAAPSVQHKKHDHMANQRYHELEGKTITEWMKENGEGDMAKERRKRRQTGQFR
jgi:hypothetical protein